MTQRENLTPKPIHLTPLIKRMLIGATIALIPIGMLLLSVDEAKPEWERFWMMKPLIMVPIAGAIGGLFFHLMDRMRYCRGWKKIVANIISVIMYIIIVWLGTVLGLNGTLWD